MNDNRTQAFVERNLGSRDVSSVEDILDPVRTRGEAVEMHKGVVVHLQGNGVCQMLAVRISREVLDPLGDFF